MHQMQQPPEGLVYQLANCVLVEYEDLSDDREKLVKLLFHWNTSGLSETDIQEHLVWKFPLDLRRIRELLVELGDYGVVTADPKNEVPRYKLTTAFYTLAKKMYVGNNKNMIEECRNFQNPDKSVMEPIFKASYEVFGMSVNARGFRKIYEMLKLFTQYYDDQEGQVLDSLYIVIGGRKISYDEADDFVEVVESNEVFVDE